ncbi:phage tail sheath family protein [Croceiramulus getboli]|nr:phage tail sheath subtilisin-like domain-containing protein [Flavobacteriaceae bacterium YJPT1-3]
MAKHYKSPGVYVEEVPFQRPPITAVATSEALFLGYTSIGSLSGNADLTRVVSVSDFEHHFGAALPYRIKRIAFDSTSQLQDLQMTLVSQLYEQVRMFFANGGQACYVGSIGNFEAACTDASVETLQKYRDLLEQSATIADISLISIADAVYLPRGKREQLQETLLRHCAEHQRFGVLDLPKGNSTNWSAKLNKFRSGLAAEHRELGAAYYPWLRSHYTKDLDAATLQALLQLPFSDPEILVNGEAITTAQLVADASKMQQIQHKIKAKRITLAPSGAALGIYARVDQQRGVWKAPANVTVLSIQRPAIPLNSQAQHSLVNDPQGMSINPMVSFPGRGHRVWGAKTLASNHSEKRYLNVVRTLQMIKRSIDQALTAYAFEPNTAATWLAVEGSVHNFFDHLWRQGALQGSKTEEAFFVKIGLGETMSQQDIDNHRMILQYGLAFVRPAEFHIQQHLIQQHTS